MNMAVRRKNQSPVRIENSASDEALRMVQEWVAELEVAAAEAADDAPHGGGRSYLDVIKQLHLVDRRKAKTTTTAPIDGPRKLTAHGVQSRGGPKIAGADDVIEVRSRNPDVMETDRIMAHLRFIDGPAYYTLWAWGSRRPVHDIAKALHCSVQTAYGNLKAAVLVTTSHVTLRTFAGS